MTCLRVFFDGELTGAENMERDTRFLENHKPGDDPILRVYRWAPAAITIGYNQNLDDFNLTTTHDAGFDIVRRPTGGRAILHADELTYAVIGTSPGSLFGSSLHESYMKINGGLLRFLGDLGLQAEISAGESRIDSRNLVCFKSAGQHEVRVEGRKLIGSAQRRKNGVFLQHGSVLAGPRHLNLPKYLQPGTPGSEMSAEQLSEVTTDLSLLLGTRQSGIDLDHLVEKLATAFGQEFSMPLEIQT